MIKKTFQNIQANNDIKEIIQSAFDLTLDISGAWGYSQKEALIIHSSTLPITQLQHTLASMRAHLEMHMTLPKEQRYAAINLNETSRETKQENDKKYDIVTYQISAILEETYASLIEEYKKGQESSDFDMLAHFEKRKAHTLTREEIYWFNVSDVTA